jgi:uncharacterized protein
MQTISGEALTSEAMRVITRLCRHWGHKLPTRIEENGGVIEFPDATVTLQALPDRLTAIIASEEAAVRERLTGVVATHLIRMAGSEPPLVVIWAKAD